MGHRLPVHLRLAEHLVLDLEEVPSVEEGIVVEEGIFDLVGLGVEGAVLSERFFFGVWDFPLCHV